MGSAGGATNYNTVLFCTLIVFFTNCENSYISEKRKEHSDDSNNIQNARVIKIKIL